MHKKRKLPGFTQAHASLPTKKCAMKIKERNKKKRHTRKNVIDRMREFIGHAQKGSIIDCKEPQVYDCQHNEGNICLVSE